MIRIPHESQGYPKADLYYDPCAYCGAPGHTYDHIVPRPDRKRLRVPYNVWWNKTRACMACNRTKRCAPLFVFLLAMKEGRGNHERVRRKMTELWREWNGAARRG